MSAIFVYVCMTMLLPMCSRQGASHWALRQTGGLRPGPAADRGPQTRPGGRQGASDRARWQTGGLRPGPVAANQKSQNKRLAPLESIRVHLDPGNCNDVRVYVCKCTSL